MIVARGKSSAMVDVLAVGEVRLVAQERVQQRVDCMEVAKCELEPGCISERTLEQTDVFFVSQVRKTMELADIPVLQMVEEPVYSKTGFYSVLWRRTSSLRSTGLLGLQSTGSRQNSNSQCLLGSRFFPRTRFNCVLLSK